MTQKILDVKTIKEITKALATITKFTSKLKDESEYANYIQYPKIPSVLSESLVIHLIKKKLILKKLVNFEITLGGKVADIIAKNQKKTIKIEVKAIGPRDFNTLDLKTL